MSAKSDARKQFAKEAELEKLRAKKAATEAKLAGMNPEERIAMKKKSTRVKIGAILIVIAFFAFFATHGSKSSAATFTGTVNSVKVINPATVNVVFSITNTSKVAGIPNCNINVSDSGGAYTGFDSPIYNTPLDAGKSLTNNINMVVTKQGAQYITTGTVTCSK